MKGKWWQETIIYQLYLRSFNDSNDDGIGDIQGVIEKLDYLKNLGIKTIWISPHYDSPMDDFGYDVRDFYKVSKDYGNTDDLYLLIEQTHKRDMKLIVDLVLNHTSDEHEWFEAAKNPKHPDHETYHDYYIWAKPKLDEYGNKTYPTNYTSFFGGPTWDYNEDTDEYYMHIFSKKMPDLNWENDQLREDMKEMINHLIDMGIDGFRVDASSHLGRDLSFPDATPGWEYFSNMPKLHKFIKELGSEIFYPRNVMTVGEAGGASDEEALMYCGFDSNEFNMLIHFGHCWQDCDDDNTLTPGKWAKGELSVKGIKESFNKWHKNLYQKGWNVIYWHNHDQPRIVSHYGNDTIYRNESAKMLCNTLYFMPGTPIVYQGEEIGMTNVAYPNLEDYRDVEVFTEYHNHLSYGATHEIAMQAIYDRARDNARSPIQWDDTPNAGFSTVTPWIGINSNYKEINVLHELNDEKSVLQHYQYVLNYRNNHLDIAYGAMDFIDLDNDDTFIYTNTTSEATYLVISNFRENDVKIHLPQEYELKDYDILVQNRDRNSIQNNMTFLPYESIVCVKKT